jgi:3-demethoxyubiquinol 3-hydroxylase
MRLPGDPSPAEARARMIRVDQAGEAGACRIYDGQIAVLKRSPMAPIVRHMARQEREHRARFDRILAERRVRPTVLAPLWHIAGFALGAASAALGERAAMACTVAVEEVIDEHYRQQLETLGPDDPELAATIAELRGHEIEHRDTGIAHGAEEAPAYGLMKELIKSGTRAAVWLSTRI